MKHVIYCTPYITLLYVLLQITCIPVETDKVSCALPYWIHILPWLSMSLYATQCMNSAFCTALSVVYVYLSTLVSELKTTISTLGYKFKGSRFVCNIFYFIILVKPVFILHGAFWSCYSYEHPTDNKSTLIQLSTVLMLGTKWLAFGINTIPADALALKVPNASTGMLLAL